MAWPCVSCCQSKPGSRSCNQRAPAVYTRPMTAPEPEPRARTWIGRWRGSVAASAVARIFLFIGIASALGFAVGFLLGEAGWPALPREDTLHIAGAVLIRVIPALAAYLVI